MISKTLQAQRRSPVRESRTKFSRKRTCLMCGHDFLSLSPANRRCASCQDYVSTNGIGDSFAENAIGPPPPQSRGHVLRVGAIPGEVAY